MPPKASQGYQNVHAFQPNRGKKLKEREKSALDTAVSTALAGVCDRCAEQLRWKKKYGKFRMAAGARRCNGCQKMNVKAAYHHTCRDCARAAKICCKCHAPTVAAAMTTAEEEARAVDALAEQMAGMRERERRAAQRALDRGEPLPARLGGTGGGSSRGGGGGGSEDDSDDEFSDDEFGSDSEGEAGASAPAGAAAAAAKAVPKAGKAEAARAAGGAQAAAAEEEEDESSDDGAEDEHDSDEDE